MCTPNPKTYCVLITEWRKYFINKIYLTNNIFKLMRKKKKQTKWDTHGVQIIGG